MKKVPLYTKDQEVLIHANYNYLIDLSTKMTHGRLRNNYEGKTKSQSLISTNNDPFIGQTVQEDLIPYTPMENYIDYNSEDYYNFMQLLTQQL